MTTRELKALDIDKQIIDLKTQLYEMELDHRTKEEVIKKKLSELNTKTFHYKPYTEKLPKDPEYFKMYQRKRYAEKLCKKINCEICGRRVTVRGLTKHQRKPICIPINKSLDTIDENEKKNKTVKEKLKMKVLKTKHYIIIL